MNFLKSPTVLFLFATILICFQNIKNLFTVSSIILAISVIFVTFGLSKININLTSFNESKFPSKTKNKPS